MVLKFIEVEIPIYAVGPLSWFPAGSAELSFGVTATGVRWKKFTAKLVDEL